MIFFLIFLFKTAYQFFFLLENDAELFEKCKDLFDFRKMEKVLQRIYFFINFSKKFLTVCILVFLHDNPNLVILLLIIFQLSFLNYIIQAKPWENEIFNILEAISEFTMLLILLLIFAIFQMDIIYKDEILISEQEINIRETIGWIFIYLFIGLMIVYFLTFVLILYKNIQENLEDILVVLESKNKRGLARIILKVMCASQEIRKKLEQNFYRQTSLDVAKSKTKEKLEKAKTIIDLKANKIKF